MALDAPDLGFGFPDAPDSKSGSEKRADLQSTCFSGLNANLFGYHDRYPKATTDTIGQVVMIADYDKYPKVCRYWGKICRFQGIDLVSFD